MDNNLAPGNQAPEILPPGNPSAGTPPHNGTLLVPAIRGPILLITIGILFALDYSAGIRFWKTWPVLLIVVGVLHLLERRGSRI